MTAAAPCPNSLWPESFDALRLDDATLALAYEHIPPAMRACIKTGIAFHYSLHGEQPEQWEQRIYNSAQGFAHSRARKAVPWTLLFMEPDYAAGPRLVAALMPALLARVPLAGVVCVGGVPSTTACATLELLGIEDIFCSADVHEAQSLLQHMLPAESTANATACALFLHTGALAPLEHAARHHGLSTWQETVAPRIALQNGSGHDTTLLQWCHPDVAFTPLEHAHMCLTDALFCKSPILRQGVTTTIPLVLAEGMEGIWWHKTLTPQFFQQQHLCARCIDDTLTEETPL